jgi:seryl-tRNA synthetase
VRFPRTVRASRLTPRFGPVYDGRNSTGGTMARKDRLHEAAKKIGAAVGKADRTAHKVVKAGKVAKDELADIKKQVEALGKQLQKTTKRLQKALS